MGIRSRLVPAASFLILTVLVALSVLFLYTERKTIIGKTIEVCRTVAAGLSSITVEGIAQNKRSLITDYLNNLKKDGLTGLIDVRVVEFQTTNTTGRSDIINGSVIGSLDYKQLNTAVSAEDLARLRSIKNFSKRTVKEGDTVSYCFYYPVIWNARLKSEDKSFLLGMIELRFDEKTILQDFHNVRDFTILIIVLALIITLILVMFNLTLTQQLEIKIDEIHKLSVTDELTHIYNRKKFNETLAIESQKSKRYNTVLSLIMFDIDHFKKVNDTFGHDIGDYVLVTVTAVVRGLLRDTDLFARWGGEEFMILAPGTTLEGSALLAEKIRLAIDNYSFKEVKSITSSFGVTTFEKNDTAEKLIKKADDALYQAKESGRNRVKIGI